MVLKYFRKREINFKIYTGSESNNGSQRPLMFSDSQGGSEDKSFLPSLTRNITLCFFINMMHFPLSVGLVPFLIHSFCSLTTLVCDHCATLHDRNFAKASSYISQWVRVGKEKKKEETCMRFGRRKWSRSHYSWRRITVRHPARVLHGNQNVFDLFHDTSNPSFQLLVPLTNSSPRLFHPQELGWRPTASSEWLFHRTLHTPPLHSPLYSQTCLFSQISLQASTCLPPPVLQVDCLVTVSLSPTSSFRSTFSVPSILV